MLFCNKTFYILFQLLAFGEYFMALGQQPAAAVFSHFKFKVFKRPLISLMVAPPPLASPGQPPVLWFVSGQLTGLTRPCHLITRSGVPSLFDYLTC